MRDIMTNRLGAFCLASLAFLAPVGASGEESRLGKGIGNFMPGQWIDSPWSRATRHVALLKQIGKATAQKG